MFTIKLISAVRRHECLYNRKLPAYRHKALKNKAWKTVAALVDSDVDRCQKRWRSLRDCFVRELAKMPNSEDKIWKYFNDMMFLRQYLTVRRRTRRIPEFVDAGTVIATATKMDYLENRYEVYRINEGEISFESESEKVDEGTNQTSDTPTNSVETVMLETKTEPIDQEEYSQIPEDSAPEENMADEYIRIERKEPMSRNINFLRLLDEYLLKLPDDTQDELKIQVLNLVFNEIMNRKVTSQANFSGM